MEEIITWPSVLSGAISSSPHSLSKAQLNRAEELNKSPFNPQVNTPWKPHMCLNTVHISTSFIRRENVVDLIRIDRRGDRSIKLWFVGPSLQMVGLRIGVERIVGKVVE